MLKESSFVSPSDKQVHMASKGNTGIFCKFESLRELQSPITNEQHRAQLGSSTQPTIASSCPNHHGSSCSPRSVQITSTLKSPDSSSSALQRRFSLPADNHSSKPTTVDRGGNPSWARGGGEWNGFEKGGDVMRLQRENGGWLEEIGGVCREEQDEKEQQTQEMDIFGQ
ncbi:hypothetical protein M0R45_035698 [Rubus argutus]|uniref:Uncharacterized protein n=1 Tax=Rubus argutus TaxID=59490 RepID=A0AAW1VY75_RUBAR